MQYLNIFSQLNNILPLARLASGSEERSEVCQRHRQTAVAIPEQSGINLHLREKHLKVM